MMCDIYLANGISKSFQNISLIKVLIKNLRMWVTIAKSPGCILKFIKRRNEVTQNKC